MAVDGAEQGTFGWQSGHPVDGAERRPERKAVARRATRVTRMPAGDQRPRGRASELAPDRPVVAEPLPPDDELWDVHSAARFLRRSVSWVYHKAEDGTLPARRLGGWGIRFIPGELRAWVASDGRGAR
jgi:predicted DNA-binding transcriptional regulator AlpA